MTDCFCHTTCTRHVNVHVNVAQPHSHHDLGMFICFWLVYVVALFRERNTAAMNSLDYLVERSIVGLEDTAGTDFNEIATFGNVFSWLDEAFIPTVYDDVWYNGDRKDRIDQHTFGPGHTRMAAGGSCKSGMQRTAPAATSGGSTVCGQSA